jgi:hypothetical protein
VKGLSRFFVKTFVGFLLVSVCFGLFFGREFLVWADDEASLRIRAADDSVRSAFRAVLDVEGAGGNVSGLILELDEAGGFLAAAKMAFQNGSLVEAKARADECIVKAENVSAEALIRRDSALVNAQVDFELKLAFSLVGIAVFCTVLSFVWRRFKRGYTKKLLRMKPEVASDVETR